MIHNQQKKYKKLSKPCLLMVSSFIVSFLMHNASAGTQTGAMNVSTTVQSSCSLTTNALTFSNYTGFTEVTGSTTLSVTCTNGVPYTVGADAGLNAGGTSNTNNRKMKNTASTQTLPYDLYKDSSNSTRWDIQGSGLISGTGNGAAQSITIYGKIPSGATVPAGNYTDTVTVTVNF